MLYFKCLAITHSYKDRVTKITYNTVINEIEKKYPGYDSIDVKDYYIVSKEQTPINDYLEVTIEFVLHKDEGTERIKEKFDIQYDSVNQECVKVEFK